MKSLIQVIAFDKLIRELGQLSPEEKLLNAFHAVRDIPYGGKSSQEPLRLFEKNEGTGRGKHRLLKQLVASLGHDVRHLLCRHNLAELPIDPWPEALAAFRGKTITGYHDFLRVKVGGRFVIVDATYDKPLTAIGFPLLEWDGKSDMDLPVQMEEIIEVQGDLAEERKALIAALPEQMQEERKRFLRTMKEWIEETREKRER